MSEEAYRLLSTAPRRGSPTSCRRANDPARHLTHGHYGGWKRVLRPPACMSARTIERRPTLQLRRANQSGHEAHRSQDRCDVYHYDIPRTSRCEMPPSWWRIGGWRLPGRPFCGGDSMTRKTPGSGIRRLTGAGYAGIQGGIVELLDAARRSAGSVNALMTTSYWEIGRRIVQAEQKGRRRAGYGEQLMARLSAGLTARFERGFSRQPGKHAALLCRLPLELPNAVSK